MEQLLQEKVLLEKRLSEVNTESAKRRRELKEAKDKLEGLETSGKTDLEKLQAEHAKVTKAFEDLQAELIQYRLNDTFRQVASSSRIIWASEQAQDDAFTLAKPMLISAMVDGVIDSKAAKDVLTTVLEGRKYLVQEKKAPDIDSTKRTVDSPPRDNNVLLEAKRKQLGRPTL